MKQGSTATVARMAILAGTALLPLAAAAVESAATPTLPPSTDDRIVLSVDGSTLTGTNGGGGASAGWLHNFDADTLAGVAIEGQKLANANWTFGSLNGAKTVGAGNARYSFYGELREGQAHDLGTFLYSSEAVGVIGSFFRQLTLQVEDKQFNILSAHGNLPKVGIGYQWNPHIATSASYAYTVGGNLGTKLAVLRIDDTNPTVNFLAGVAFGTASPVVLNGGFLAATASTLREGYAGFSMPFPAWRSDLSVVADYIHLAKSVNEKATVVGNTIFIPVDSTHVTLTVSYIFHFGQGPAR